MQELLSLLKKETYSEDHYIIDKISPFVLNSRIEELFLQANDCIDDENFSEALLFYNLILKEDSKNIHALIDRGTTFQNGRYGSISNRDGRDAKVDRLR